MAKPTSKSALKTRLNALKTELDELQAGARELAGTAPNEAEGLSRACREMRKTIDRVISQGFVAKL
jgi:hypothetical protein